MKSKEPQHHYRYTYVAPHSLRECDRRLKVLHQPFGTPQNGERQISVYILPIPHHIPRYEVKIECSIPYAPDKNSGYFHAEIKGVLQPLEPEKTRFQCDIRAGTKMPSRQDAPDKALVILLLMGGLLMIGCGLTELDSGKGIISSICTMLLVVSLGLLLLLGAWDEFVNYNSDKRVENPHKATQRLLMETLDAEPAEQPAIR